MPRSAVSFVTRRVVNKRNEILVVGVGIPWWGLLQQDGTDVETVEERDGLGPDEVHQTEGLYLCPAIRQVGEPVKASATVKRLSFAERSSEMTPSLRSRDQNMNILIPYCTFATHRTL